MPTSEEVTGSGSDSQQDCQYGDRTDCDEVTAGYQCYDPDTMKECCATCGGFRTAINDCNFGDRNDTICGDIENVDCYDGQIKDICCETCHAWKTGIYGCMYGDKIMTCTSRYCHKYEPHILGACCETCDDDSYTPTPTFTPTPTPTPSITPPDCQDELSNCEFSQCNKYSPSKRWKCCYTCGGMFPGSTMTSPSTSESTSALPSKSSSATLPIAVSVGCLVCVVIIVVVVICWIRRRRSHPKNLSPIDEVMYNEYKLSAKAAKRAPIPQPRDPSMEKKPHPLDRQDTGTYAYIRPEEVASIPRRDNNKSANDNKGRDGNDPLPPVPGDYLELELVGNYGYMEAVDKRNKSVKKGNDEGVKTDPYSEPYEDNVIRKQENEYVKLQKGQEYHNYDTSNGHLQERM